MRELEKLLHKQYQMLLSDKELKAIMSHVDTDENGRIDIMEYFSVRL